MLVVGFALPLKRTVREVWHWGENSRTITGTVWMGTRPGGGAFVQEHRPGQGSRSTPTSP